MRAAIVVAGTWHLANDLPGTINGWTAYRWPAVAMLAWLTVAALIVLATMNLASKGGKRRPRLAVAGVVALLAISVVALANATGASCQSAFAQNGSTWATFGWCAMLLFWRSPLRWLVGALGLNALVGLIALAGAGCLDRVELSRYIMVLYGSTAIQLGLAGGARAVQRSGRHAERAPAERVQGFAPVVPTRRATTAETVGMTVGMDGQRRCHELGRSVRELLTGLSSHRLDPNDRQVQARCALEASRLRRLFAEHDDAPWPLLHELRACADLAERRGVTVTLDAVGPVPDLPVVVRRALTEAPMRLLSAAGSHARVTVVSATRAPVGTGGASDASNQLANEVEVSVVTDRDVEVSEWQSPCGDVAVTWSGEGDTQWVKASWRGP